MLIVEILSMSQYCDGSEVSVINLNHELGIRIWRLQNNASDCTEWFLLSNPFDINDYDLLADIMLRAWQVKQILDIWYCTSRSVDDSYIMPFLFTVFCYSNRMNISSV